MHTQNQNDNQLVISGGLGSWYSSHSYLARRSESGERSKPKTRMIINWLLAVVEDMEMDITLDSNRNTIK